MKQIICHAINSQQELCFIYHGGVRHAEPHCYGISKGGHELLRVYQTSGSSESGHRTGWKLFRVDEMEQIKIGGQGFDRPRGGYKRRDPDMTRIYCQV